MRALNDLIGRDWKLPIVRIDANTDHDVSETLCHERGLDFLWLVGFGVAEVWRTKQNRRAADFRFDQPLRRIQFQLSQRQRNFTEVRMREGMIADLVTFVDDAAHEIRDRPGRSCR